MTSDLRIEIEYPMATGSSTLPNLLVVPLVYARFGYEAAPEREGGDELF